ncbi:MFS transporter [Paenibacillus sp. 1P03SA]|uniref:MFS transporter n=1 Tax=Paenibacillus sp. 1P03SA TaxID=3132294 RepID=UPI0039A334FC
MTQLTAPGTGSAAGTRIRRIPSHLIISVLTILTIGPQYFLNVSFILNQTLIQSTLTSSSKGLLLLSIVSNLAFALCVPIGPAVTRRYGIRRSYSAFMLVFLLGSLLNLLSPNMGLLLLGRILQGLGSGSLFLTILPVSLRSFPNRVRNRFLLLAVGGLFGSSAVGALLGSLSLTSDTWRWLFALSAVTSILCLLVGPSALPAEPSSPASRPAPDKSGIAALTLFMSVLTVPLYYLQEKGPGSLYVWPFFVICLLLLILFLTLDYGKENPLLPWRALLFSKPVFGTVMSIASHISLIIVLAGTNGVLRSVREIPFMNLTYFYLWFFIGIMASALLCTVLYDRLGPGILGFIGSLAVIAVSLQWLHLDAEVPLSTMYMQIACLGGGISMTLISGALGTAMAGNLHHAALRSVSLHFMRNLAGAVAAPFVGRFLFRHSAVHYETLRNQMNVTNPALNAKISELAGRLTAGGLSAAEAKKTAASTLLIEVKKTALLGAYQNLFTFLLVLGIVMLLASTGKALTGKGRSLVQKEQAAKARSAQDTAPVLALPKPPREHI